MVTKYEMQSALHSISKLHVIDFTVLNGAPRRIAHLYALRPCGVALKRFPNPKRFSRTSDHLVRCQYNLPFKSMRCNALNHEKRPRTVIIGHKRPQL